MKFREFSEAKDDSEDLMKVANEVIKMLLASPEAKYTKASLGRNVQKPESEEPGLVIAGIREWGKWDGESLNPESRKKLDAIIKKVRSKYKKHKIFIVNGEKNWIDIQVIK